MEEILIPKEKLLDGFDRSKRHIELLLECSDLLYQDKKYSLSLPLSVLALEEYRKLIFIQKHIRSETGITKKEWIAITKSSKKKSVHKTKLADAYKEPKSQVIEKGWESYYHSAILMEMLRSEPPKMTYWDAKQPNPIVEERLMALDSVKQDCFYLGWKNSDWSNFIKVSKPQRKALAYIVKYVVRRMLVNSLLEQKHKQIHLDENAEDFKAYKNDPLFKEELELEGVSRTAEFKKLNNLAWTIVDQYRSIS